MWLRWKAAEARRWEGDEARGWQAGRRGSGGTAAERQNGSGDGDAGEGLEAGVVVARAVAAGWRRRRVAR